MPRRPKPVPSGVRECPRFFSEDYARALAAEHGLRADYDLHHELQWRLGAFDFFRERPPLPCKRRRQLLDLFLEECGRVLSGDRARERALVERLSATPGLPPSDLLECQAAVGWPLDVNELRQYQVWAEDAKRRLTRARPPVAFSAANELFLLWQLRTIWLEGTGAEPSVWEDQYTGEYRGPFLSFAQRVLERLHVTRSNGAVHQALKRLRRARRNSTKA